MHDRITQRFAEILDEAVPYLDEVAFADLVDECVEDLGSAFATVSGR